MGRSRNAAGGVSRRLVTTAAATAVAAMVLGGAGALAQGSGLGTADKPVEIRVSANEAFSNQVQTVIVPESWFSASRYAPVGSIAKFRGVLPPVGSWPSEVRRPVSGSMLNMAMLSCPRFEP